MATNFRGNIVARALAVVGVAGLLMIGGCNSGAKFPDSVDAVNTALAQNNLANIHVSQDRYKGVITLTGTVPTEDQRMQAQSVAMRAAATYTVQDKIAVVPAR